MPLHGKIVVIKRSGGDGTEFPLTATCLFGRKPDCDIRIQLPQVSKEHCRIDFNENKEVILTNLSSVNQTRVNGEVLQQAERLKHGDVITIIDRSFRFEYPPAPTPKKRSSVGGKSETFKVLQDQQLGDTVTSETGERRISEVSTDPHLKDGANNDNIQRSLEKTMEVESNKDDGLQKKTTSPFSDLYQMIKKSLDVKTPRKSSASLLQTPSSKFCTPKPVSVRKTGGNAVISTREENTPKKDEAEIKSEAENASNGTPKSLKKQRKSFQVASAEMTTAEGGDDVKSEATSPQKRKCATPQRFTVCEVIEQVTAQTTKSPVRRRSKEATPAKSAVPKEQETKPLTSPKSQQLRRTSPRNSGKVEKVKETSKKRKSEELAGDLAMSQMKRKRVSFGGHLSPELFDKRMPPDSPLRKGAAPRRSLCLIKPKQSLLRRASAIGLLKEHSDSPRGKSPAKVRTPSPKKTSSGKKASLKTPSPGKKSPKSRSPSPKAATPAKKSPKSRATSPKEATPANKTPKSRSPSPKAATPAKKTPKSRSPSPKAATPAKKTPKSRSPSPKAATPAKKTPKSRSPSPKAATPAKKTPKSRSPSPKAATPAKKTPKSRSTSPKAATPGKKSSPKASKQATPGLQTPTVQGRFSVSRISTPSPLAEDALTPQVRAGTATPKLPLRRKSMKTPSRKTPSIAKSAVKVMCRRSGVSRASMKAKISWAEMVKFGKVKSQPAVSANKVVTKMVTKKRKATVPKPQTPARNLKGNASTGHANSPLTIVVGRAHIQRAVHPTGAAPRVIANTTILKKNTKMDEDLTGISEMYKTPVNERKVRSVINESSAMKTPVSGLGTSVIDPSVLNTPEEPGEMMVSPLSVSSAVKGEGYNSEAVQRLLNGDEESIFISDVPAAETNSDDSSQQQCNDLKTDSVTTPKQKPELPDCLTGVKQMMKTPRQKAEPVEDLRGRLLKTPKQKPAQKECLTGVKRIMTTPRQKAEPIEDLRGKILKTPKQKPEQQECFSGVKRIFETPQREADLQEAHLETPKAPEDDEDDVREVVETPARMQESEEPSEVADMQTPDLKTSPAVCLTGIKRIMKTPEEKNAPVEDFEGLKELMEEPLPDVTELETNEVDVQVSLDCGGDVAQELDFALEEPQDDVPSDVIANVPQVNMEKESDADEVEEQPEVDTVVEAVAEVEKVSEMDTTAADPEKKSVRGRRAKTEESKSAEETQDATGHSEESVVPAPVRGRRGKKCESTAPPAVRQTTRSRNAKTTEVAAEKSEPLPSDAALKPKRGRNAKKTSDDEAEMVQEVAAEPETAPEPEKAPEPVSDPSLPAEVEHETNAAPLEKAVLKPKRGRKAKKPEQDVPEQQDVPCTQSDVPQADVAKEADDHCSDQLEVVPSGSENTPSDAMETVPQEPAAEALPEVETAAPEIPEMDAPIVQKKTVRGRRAKTVESKSPEEVTEASEDVVPPPVRGRRGRKNEATTLPVRQTSRRNAKTQEDTVDQVEMVPEKAVETTEVSAEAVSDQTSHQEENDSAPPAEEEVVQKPTRGRKSKTPGEPEKVVTDEQLNADAPKSAVGKPKRGRKIKPDSVEDNEVTEEAVVAVETKQQPPVRAKRGRNAKREEENDDKTLGELTESQEPIKKLRRTRKAEQDHIEPKEVQTTETVVPEEPEAPVVAETAKVTEENIVAAKSRRGGRKAKVAESDNTEVQEVPAASATDKPKRGRRGKQVPAEVEVTAVVPEEKPAPELEEAEEKLVIKPSRARGVKTQVSLAVPAKRARRGAALPLEETNAESTVLVSESAPVQPVKRGRRAAAKPTAAESMVTDDQANPTEDSSNAVVEDTKMSKRSVKWKADIEVHELPKGTPVKAVRGRKAKLVDQVEAESQQDASEAEEKDLSAKVGDAQPAKRARRGAKSAEVSAGKEESAKKVESAEAEPKTRRGRSAKK